jgi:hypothetical protein
LAGLKENVIIGRLIPAGTGFKDMEYELIGDVEAKRLERETEATSEMSAEVQEAFADNTAVNEGTESAKEGE